MTRYRRLLRLPSTTRQTNLAHLEPPTLPSSIQKRTIRILTPASSPILYCKQTTKQHLKIRDRRLRRLRRHRSPHFISSVTLRYHTGVSTFPCFWKYPTGSIFITASALTPIFLLNIPVFLLFLNMASVSSVNQPLVVIPFIVFRVGPHCPVFLFLSFYVNIALPSSICCCCYYLLLLYVPTQHNPRITSHHPALPSHFLDSVIDYRILHFSFFRPGKIVCHRSVEV